MKLIAYNIDVEGTPTPLNELGRGWSDDELNGNDPFKAIADTDTIPTDYTDESSIENWAKYGIYCLDKFFGFHDWKCLRNEIKKLALSITSDNLNDNWSLLNYEEQKITCQYVTNLVPSVRFVETYSDPNQRTQISGDFDKNSSDARFARVGVMRMYLMNKIGPASAINFLRDVITHNLIEAYIAGIEQKSTDGVSGMFDIINGNAGTEFETQVGTGDKQPLIDRTYTITDGSGDAISDVCSDLTNIGLNGLY